MTKAERRIKDFSSGMKDLDSASQNKIHNLAKNLLLIEKTPVCPAAEKKPRNLKEKGKAGT